MGRRLMVIDGADEGRSFPLFEGNKFVIGNSRKHSDICLHDLYVSRVHCELDVSEDTVVLSGLEDSQQGTLLNGQKIGGPAVLKFGDVIRVGNSYLRFQHDEDEEEEEDDEVVEAVEAEPETPKPAESVAVGGLPKLTPERLKELSGHTLGHYEVGSVLGTGHCGMVFRARDTKKDKVVALKVFSPEFPKNDKELQKFVQAMKSRLPLRHPNLVGVHGAGKNGPYCWLALEYVEGESLTQVLERLAQARKIDWRRGLRVALHVGRALQYLHRNHFLHGNITPRNVLIGIDKVARLNDLMLSKALEGSAVHLASLQARAPAELAYLAPEQTEDNAFVDELSDVYSLGVAVYALLTGRPPFLGETPEETLDLIRQGALVKPSHYQETIPESMERVVLRMLARFQEDRYQSPTQLLGDLETVAEEEDVEV